MPYNTQYRSTGWSWSGNLPPAVKWLLILNIGIFLLEYFLRVFAPGVAFALLTPLYLVPSQVIHGAIWQPVTYMFLHDPGGFGHILINMLTLWMFGTTLENTWGSRRFLNYYFTCGIGAAFCVIIAGLLFGQGEAATLGASGAIYGLLLAFGVLFPRTKILFFFLFPVEARWFVIIVGAMAFLSSISASGGGVSHIAHLGGMIFGLIYLKTSLLQVRGYAGGGVYAGGGYAYPKPRRKSLTQSLRERYKEWKLQRARRKFEVYLRKRQERERDRDRFVH